MCDTWPSYLCSFRFPSLVLDENGEAALQNYVNSGGNFVGIHAASDCQRNSSFFGKELGACSLCTSILATLNRDGTSNLIIYRSPFWLSPWNTKCSTFLLRYIHSWKHFQPLCWTDCGRDWFLSSKYEHATDAMAYFWRNVRDFGRFDENFSS